MCLHLSVISFLLTSQAAAFETFSRGVFGIIVWHSCLKKQIHKSEMMVSVKKNIYGVSFPNQQIPNFFAIWYKIEA